MELFFAGTNSHFKNLSCTKFLWKVVGVRIKHTYALVRELEVDLRAITESHVQLGFNTSNHVQTRPSTSKHVQDVQTCVQTRPTVYEAIVFNFAT